MQTASSFDARVTIRDLTNGRGPADAASLNGVAMLGATQGHEVEVAASGPQASEALAAIHALAERDFDDRPEPNAAPAVATPSLAAPDVTGIVRGHPASPGIAIGPARRFRTPDLPIPEGPGSGADAERAAFDAALADVRDEIVRQREHVAGMASADEAEIFDAHLLFLKDDALLAPTRDAIADGNRSAAQAWHDVIERTAAQWDALEDEYLRARAADLRSVGRQVLARLLGLALPGPELEAPGVVIARDLTPADTVGLDPSMALGIVTAAGGPTSHAAVLARSSGIPAVVGAGDSVLTVPEGTPVALDGSTGVVYVDPEPSVVSELTAARDARDAVVREAQASALEPARTIDGVTIEVAANIGSPADAVARGRGRRRRRRAVPDGVPVHGSVGDAGRARAGGGVSRDGRGAGRTSAADPHARRRRRQAHPLPRPAERGEPVPRRARHPARPRSDPSSSRRSSGRSCGSPPTIRSA